MPVQFLQVQTKANSKTLLSNKNRHLQLSFKDSNICKLLITSKQLNILNIFQTFIKCFFPWIEPGKQISILLHALQTKSPVLGKILILQFSLTKIFSEQYEFKISSGGLLLWDYYYSQSGKEFFFSEKEAHPSGLSTNFNIFVFNN